MTKTYRMTSRWYSPDSATQQQMADAADRALAVENATNSSARERHESGV